ncbi:MAG TPA: tyrosine-type recombinase/integrase [Chitinophagaceae bacterium]|nr:tyrosine-type recombinase/integrase [Chitinophagaceae bacterium]
MSSVTVMLRTYRARKDATYPIVIRVYANNKNTFEYIGYSVKEDQFRDKPGNWIYRHQDATLINNKIETKRQEIIAKIDEKAGYVKIQGSKLTSLSKYLDKRAAQFKASGRVDMDRKLRRQKTEIEEMAGRETFFQEINMDWIRTYQAHNATAYKNCNNTIMRKIKNLRTIYKQAIGDKWAEYPNPFDNFKLHFDPVNKTKLTREEIKRMEKLTLTGIMDVARDTFVLAFYCHGMRFENIFTLEWEQIHGGKLKYQMNKGKKTREITLQPQALAILEKYKREGAKWVFPLCKKKWRDKEDFLDMKGSANALINDALKNVAKLAEIDKHISTHIARHSFAYLMKKKKVDMHVVKDALGHTNMSTTETYMDDLDDDTINEEVNKAFD